MVNKEKSKTNRLILTQPQTRKAIADYYNISIRTLDIYLKKFKIGVEKSERLISPKNLRDFVKQFEGIETGEKSWLEQ
jgi:hypothetical protein